MSRGHIEKLVMHLVSNMAQHSCSYSIDNFHNSSRLHIANCILHTDFIPTDRAGSSNDVLAKLPAGKLVFVLKFGIKVKWLQSTTVTRKTFDCTPLKEVYNVNR